MVYFHSEPAFSQKASNQENVAVWEKHFLELAQKSLMSNPVGSLLYIEKDCGRLFDLAAGFRFVLHQSHQLMSGEVLWTEAELFGYPRVQSFKMVSHPTLYETLEDFLRWKQETNGPEIVRSRRILARFRYHDYCGRLSFRGEVGQSEADRSGTIFPVPEVAGVRRL